MKFTRRDLGRLTLSAVPALRAIGGEPAAAMGIATPGDEILKHRRGRAGMVAVAAVVLAMVAGHDAGAQGAAAPSPAVELVRIGESDVREWLTALSSDAMQGRGAFTEGYGLAAGYVSEQLRRIGATPAGIDGTYLYPVTRASYRVIRKSTVTIEVKGQRRTFTQGEHVSFPANAGSARRLTFTGIDFVGYGFPPDDSSSLHGRLVVMLPGMPAVRPASAASPAMTSATGRAEALVHSGAAAVVMFGSVQAGASQNGNRAATTPLTTVERVDLPRAPVVTADEAALEFLLSGAPEPFDTLRTRAARGESLAPFTLADIRVTIDVNHTYEPTRMEHTHNVVALVPGTDPELRDTYVLFGAHLDHVGAFTSGAAPGRVNVPVDRDPIWNGADDDGSGSVALLAIAKALVEGPRPKRSALFVWHAAEEEGLLGSRALADDPPVPLDHIQAVFNIDMIGRNRDDDLDQADTVFLIGADRISTDLHNIIVAANDTTAGPMTLDYFYNDPDDTESFYTRSDHYSYASRGIPAAFFFTGTHRDYHANTDTVDKILFPKLVRITQLIYQAGFSVADRPTPLVRDNRGPRAGRGFRGPIQ